MQFVCKNCFADKELKGLIVSQNHIGQCDFCHSHNIEVISVEELYDYFKELIENFQPKDNGESMISKIQNSWNLFSSSQIGKSILNYFFEEIDTPLNRADDLVNFNDEILENIKYWSDLKKLLKEERRYINNIDYLINDLGWDGFFESKTTVTTDNLLYRARLHNDANEDTFQKKKMFCPPKKDSSAGRANPIGIPYLYLSDNENTVLYEIRASFLDEVSVASFRIKENLQNDIIISDFTETPSLYAPGEINQRIKATLLKQYISADLSKPMRRYDSELDYIPTQFICEFIKVFTNVHGIKFKSSLHNTGNNIVIFDQEIMECVAVHKVKISNVLIDSQQI